MSNAQREMLGMPHGNSLGPLGDLRGPWVSALPCGGLRTSDKPHSGEVVVGVSRVEAFSCTRCGGDGPCLLNPDNGTGLWQRMQGGLPAKTAYALSDEIYPTHHEATREGLGE